MSLHRVPSDVSCVNAAVAGSGCRSCCDGERQLEGSREPAELRGEGRGRQGMPLVIAVLININYGSYSTTADD